MLGKCGQCLPYSPLGGLWPDGQARAVEAEGGAFAIDNVADAANALLGAVLLGVLGRSMSGTDATDPAFQRQLTEQVVRGVLTR